MASRWTRYSVAPWMRPSCSGWPGRTWRPCDYLALLRRACFGELRTLIEEIANGETAFFRNAAHFRALRDVVLPALLTEARRVVFWSAAAPRERRL